MCTLKHSVGKGGTRIAVAIKYPYWQNKKNWTKCWIRFWTGIIRQRWNVRKATYHYGNNILRVMGGISDVDTTALAEALKHPDLSAIMLEARKLKL